MLSITKLQNLKAIHNKTALTLLQSKVVINHKTTKFESNSQQTAYSNNRVCCYQSQNYKIWKQFTTALHRLKSVVVLLSITKLQNLKAIHNNLDISKNHNNVVINRKTTKFESNSQQNSLNITPEQGCYQSQNYKIWKEFTTGSGNDEKSA